MAYIGKSIESGTFSVLDTSGNTYNGSNVTFSLGTQVGSPAQLLVSHDGVIQKPGTDYTLATGGTQITFTTAPASGASIFIVEISGAVGGPLDSDLNGTELILDADADTSITADTDDQIDIKVAGTDQLTIKDGALSPVTDNDIDLGTSSLEFKDAYFDGTVTSDAGLFDTLGVGTTRDQGVLHVRTADSGATAGTDSDELVLENSAAGGLTILSGTAANGKIAFGDSGDADIGAIIYEHDGNNLRFHSGGAERMRILSDGDISIGATANEARLDTRYDANASGFQIVNAKSSGCNSSTKVAVIQGDQDSSGSYDLVHIRNGGGHVCNIADSGNIQNSGNSYGSLSDNRIKQNITDASSQWNDIKALKIKNFKLKKLVNRDGDSAPTHLGVIAQDLETSNMNGLVEEINPTKEDVALNSDFGTVVSGTADNGATPITDEEGKITGYKDIFTEGQKVKTVKYSVLYMKAIKALQEAITEIESLKARVTTLEE